MTDELLTRLDVRPWRRRAAARIGEEASGWED
jgi:hypothetical protein